MRRVVGSIVETMARSTVNLEVSLTELDGTVMLWLAPPPSNVIWLSFLEPPKLKLTAKPLNTNSLLQATAVVCPRCQGTVCQHATRACQRRCAHRRALQAVKLSAFVEHKLRQALQKNMVFPACTDLRASFLLSFWDLGTPAVLPFAVPPPPAGRKYHVRHAHSGNASQASTGKRVARTPSAPDLQAFGSDRELVRGLCLLSLSS